MSTVTAAKLSTIASELTTLHGALVERATDFGDVIESSRTGLELLGQAWRGPVRDDLHGQVSGYVESVAAVVEATDSAATTIDGWATAATDASERLAALEVSQGTAEALIASAVDPESAERASESLGRINSSITEVVTGWATTCVTKGAALNSAISTLQQASLVEMGTVDQRAALLGDGYSLGLAAWAAQHDMDLSILDPTGGLGRAADEHLADFADSEYAALMYAVIETMNQADISKMDGKSSRDDWLLSTDPEIVRFRLEIAARLAGLELSEEQLDELTGQIINAAVFGAATDGDGRGSVDDQFDEHAEIETALDNDGATERDHRFPESPSEADEYLQTWLEAQWEGDKGILDYATMLLIPDFEVMNPWSDEFHPGWALVEVLGIVPWTKFAKLATLAKLGRHGDEMTDAVRLFDESADILGDAGRISDDVVAAGDDVVGASDELAASSDEIATAAGDDLSHLGKADPRVVDQLDEVRAPVMDELQTQVDRIWAETQEALPGASPQQLGTRAHRELEAWIKAHGDELVDPDSGYRIQAEISFVEGGDEAARGTAGSIRPDVILERRTVDEVGNETWEVVEVADLKTGRAGITGSWQRKVDEWLTPTHTTEIRPGPRIPVPE